MALSAKTEERHLSYEFIKRRQISPGEWAMARTDSPELLAICEEYEEKGPSIPCAETRGILARLARIGREELAERAAEGA